MTLVSVQGLLEHERIATERSAIQVQGTVREALPSALYRVELGDGRSILAHVDVKLRQHGTRLIPGDRVILEVFSTNHTRGRIKEVRRWT